MKKLNIIDRALLPFVPERVLKRVKARASVQAYEAVESTRYRKRSGNTRSGNAEVLRAGSALRQEARYMDRDSDLARGILDTLTTNTVGTGIVPEPQARRPDGSPATEFNKRAAELFEQWARTPEVTGQHDLYSAQRLLARSMYRDGESFVQLILGQRAGAHLTPVPFSLELIEADMCPIEYDSFAAPASVSRRGLRGNRKIRQGIEINAWNRPVAYYFHREHPGEVDNFTAIATNMKRVTADRIQHLKQVDRISQLRGVSRLAAVMNRLKDVKEIDETERVAARVAASFAVAIIKGEPHLYEGGTDDEYRELDLEPGLILDDLMPGEDVKAIGSSRPNPQLIAFRNDQLRSAAAGAGVSYSSISKNYDGTFSSQRQELVESYMSYSTLTDYFTRAHVQPVYEKFVEAAILAGLLPTQGVDVATLKRATYSRPQMPWIDPQKEAKANEIMLQNGVMSESEIIRQRGKNPTKVREQIAQDKEEREALGISPEPDVPALPGGDDDEGEN